jgi:hypothetical protein
MDLKKYEDLYKIPIFHLPKIEQPFIGGSQLEIYSNKGRYIQYKDEHSFNNGILSISNGEKFTGILNPTKTSIFKGQYEWNNHQIYSGYFNNINLFDSKDKKLKSKIIFPSKDKFECILIMVILKAKENMNF